jgi:hypothetical protein
MAKKRAPLLAVLITVVALAVLAGAGWRIYQSVKALWPEMGMAAVFAPPGHAGARLSSPDSKSPRREAEPANDEGPLAARTVESSRPDGRHRPGD